MTSLEDKAESPESQVYSIEDAAETGAAAEFKLRSMDLVEADEVGTEAFPRFGDWLPVTELRDGLEVGDVHVECPRGLAAELVEQEVETGDVFDIETVEKVNEEWSVEVDVRD